MQHCFHISLTRLGLLLILALMLVAGPGHAAEPAKADKPVKTAPVKTAPVKVAYVKAPSPPAKADKDKSVTKASSLALDRYHALEFSPTLAKDRQNWLLCAKAFQRAYEIDPYHPSAPNTLLSQGDFYLQIYKKFSNKEDLNESLSYYDDVVTLFPQHSLADDALYRTATIHAEELSDSKSAALLLAKLVAVYPKGDLATQAKTQLSKLKSALFAQTSPPPAKEKGPNAQPTPDKTNPASPSASPPTGGKLRPAEVVSVRHWSTENYTRVVIETTAPVDYQGHQLKKDDDASSKRLYVDLQKCAIARDLQQAIPITDGLLQRMRSAQFDPNTVRVVLDTLVIADYKIFNLDDPFRIIIDVKGTADAKLPPLPAAASTVLPTSKNKGANTTPKLKAPPSLAQQLGLGIKRVVLDPGHGGKDPGAIGINGLREKDIVLNVAKKVARQIGAKMGVEVVLTRKTDVFIPLEERTAIANTKGGDLFISIHANAAPSPQAQGIETYYLDLAASEADRGLAALENASSTRQISDLQNILSSLMQNSKKDESARLAGIVQNNMVSGLCKAYPGITNHGVKTAPFIVLIGAQMPSILTEIAFISNPLEAQRLQEDQYLEALADHITAGVANYSSSLTMARL